MKEHTALVEETFDGRTIKLALLGAEKCLEDHIDELNLLNVFPVPDGDTGINMFVTIQAANKAAAVVPSDSAAAISAGAARGALLGASGNSGVILSQILRGVAKGMEMKERFTVMHFANALREAAEMAHRAVTNPVEGTILTVSRETSEVAMKMAKSGADLKQTLTAIVEQAKKSVKKTPELLPQLKEAGVVDAGGKGLLYVYQGMSDYLSRRVNKFKTVATETVTRKTGGEQGDYGLDIQFLIRGHDMPLDDIRETLEKMGESVIVVGDENLIRVHIHAPDSEDIMSYAGAHGQITDIAIENMDEQVKDFKEKIDSGE
ncbi:MAG: hypothetical protein A2Z02_04035 [Chloroflexi bacterium RBG_16_48_7]|nr:MAG: hypothetical protein A2Z02_04035 [Chloroflexi bacterium RBG_16_48_7]